MNWEEAASLLVSMRHLPLLGRLLPAPQIIEWGTPTVYRIRLDAVSCFTPDTPICYEAILPDAAPWGAPLSR